MRKETEDKVKLNELCKQYLALKNTAPKDASAIMGEMFPLAKKVASPARRMALLYHLDQDDFDMVLTDKFYHILTERNDVQPENFSNLLIDAVRRGLIDVARRKGTEAKHKIDETDLRVRSSRKEKDEMTPLEFYAIDRDTRSDNGHHAIMEQDELRAIAKEYQTCLQDSNLRGIEMFRAKLDGVSNEELARRFKTSVKAAKSVLSRVRKQIRNHPETLQHVAETVPSEDMDSLQKGHFHSLMCGALDELIAERQQLQIQR